ncbi:hypothetical protein [Spirosoma aerolatum]|uniref:hypothetical protein n=1 Tax=Spirosoma aerolatum TaxID=1211326 RepID=UPI0009AED7AC|nr:hypothetical protein [Spirosoma aerolatum]
MKLSKSDLRALFVIGKKLSQEDFWAIIDSLVHLDDQEAVDSQVVNTRIAAYDTALKASNVDGVCSTLGDVFSILTGYSDLRRINDELKWTGIPGRPTQINLTWTEQTITTDSSAYNPLGSTGTAGAGPSQRWLLSTVGGLSGSYLVVDVKTDRHWITTGPELGYYVDSIIAVKVAITPKTVL